MNSIHPKIWLYPGLIIHIETYIGNILVWKHHLETKNMYTGNKHWILKTYELDWKHILHIQNITFVWKHTYVGKNIKKHH